MHYTLLDLNEHLRRVVALNFQTPLWITAEVAQANHSRGHWYIDLIQKGAEGSVIAQQAAVLWAADARSIQKTLGVSPDALMREGLALKLRVQPDFHERYGLKLIITEIDPAHTVGQLELRRRQTLQTLYETNLLKQNRSLRLPLVVQRIAVVSSEDAAGYQDFQKQLTQNAFGYQFHTRFFRAAVQGKNAEPELLAAFRAVAAQYRSFDCIVVLRGGGAKLDLAVFDEPELCTAAAMLPLPLITGIGHETDESILDIIAHTAQKTPTAVADFLIQHNLFFENILLQSTEHIRRISETQLKIKTLEINQAEAALQWGIRENIRTASRSLLQAEQEIPQMLARILRYQHLLLEEAAAKCTVADPAFALRRGYSITRHKGKAIRSVSEIQSGEQITIQVADGVLAAEIRDLRHKT